MAHQHSGERPVAGRFGKIAQQRRVLYCNLDPACVNCGIIRRHGHAWRQFFSGCHCGGWRWLTVTGFRRSFLARRLLVRSPACRQDAAGNGNAARDTGDALERFPPIDFTLLIVLYELLEDVITEARIPTRAILSYIRQLMHVHFANLPACEDRLLLATLPRLPKSSLSAPASIDVRGSCVRAGASPRDRRDAAPHRPGRG